jgi:hypothetical protein
VCNQHQGRVRPNGEVQETLPLFPRLSSTPLHPFVPSRQCRSSSPQPASSAYQSAGACSELQGNLRRAKLPKLRPRNVKMDEPSFGPILLIISRSSEAMRRPPAPARSTALFFSTGWMKALHETTSLCLYMRPPSRSHAPRPQGRH